MVFQMYLLLWKLFFSVLSDWDKFYSVIEVGEIELAQFRSLNPDFH